MVVRGVAVCHGDNIFKIAGRYDKLLMPMVFMVFYA